LALDNLSDAVGETGCGIVADMNGSARSVSIDYTFLTSLGCTLRVINDRPRGFAHRIVPEGKSLDPCKAELALARSQDERFRLGYVPDCDGDRGNLVVWDGNGARPLQAQETYALALLAELSDLARKAGPGVQLAAVGNDATSMRSEAVCKALGVRFFRAETGEANVVGLARSLRNDGWAVRILGEGSNGGVITWPAAVRDPLNTIAAVLKLMYLKDEGDTAGPWKFWLEKSDQPDLYRDAFELSDILKSLPPWTSTSVFEDRAALRVSSTDHTALKNAYQQVFVQGWPELSSLLASRYGQLSWRAMATNGIQERTLSGAFGESGTGGLRIVLSDTSGTDKAFLWMRGSGTEAVFRIMVDLEGDCAELERRMLMLHASWLRTADASCCAAH
ncbi:MAG TPA: phosphatidylglycerol lysyltransferase, partial [Spirochaetales bacterium]|nr:phosphatidylglycerol lysyltransferase [Spirochaetales bacterium]